MSLRGALAVLVRAILILSPEMTAAALVPTSPIIRRYSFTPDRSVLLDPSGHFLKQPPGSKPLERPLDDDNDEMAKSHNGKAVSLITAKAPRAKKSLSAAEVTQAVDRKLTTTSSAVKGGLAGLLTGIMQVICLMWIRTILNRQYYHGGSLSESISSLWAEGGLTRFYSGINIALIQVPLAKFGTTFVQTAVTTSLGMPGQLLHGSAVGLIVATLAALWKLLLVPLETMVVNQQVHGAAAGNIFSSRVKTNGLLELWSGGTASFMALWIGSFPWWAVYNTVFELWPAPSSQMLIVCRNGLAGILAAVASDVASNALRVLKVKRQATLVGGVGVEGYVSDVTDVMAQDGTQGLFFRALGTRLIAGALQGAFFSVMWNGILASTTA